MLTESCLRNQERRSTAMSESMPISLLRIRISESSSAPSICIIGRTLARNESVRRALGCSSSSQVLPMGCKCQLTSDGLKDLRLALCLEKPLLHGAGVFVCGAAILHTRPRRGG